MSRSWAFPDELDLISALVLEMTCVLVSSWAFQKQCFVPSSHNGSPTAQHTNRCANQPSYQVAQKLCKLESACARVEGKMGRGVLMQKAGCVSGSKSKRRVLKPLLA